MNCCSLADLVNIYLNKSRSISFPREEISFSSWDRARILKVGLAAIGVVAAGALVYTLTQGSGAVDFDESYIYDESCTGGRCSAAQAALKVYDVVCERAAQLHKTLNGSKELREYLAPGQVLHGFDDETSAWPVCPVQVVAQKCSEVVGSSDNHFAHNHEVMCAGAREIRGFIASFNEKVLKFIENQWSSRMKDHIVDSNKLPINLESGRICFKTIVSCRESS